MSDSDVVTALRVLHEDLVVVQKLLLALVAKDHDDEKLETKLFNEVLPAVTGRR